MLLATFDIVADQGSDFRITFTMQADDGSPLDLTQHKFRMQIREAFDSNEKLLDCGSANLGVEGVPTYITSDNVGNVVVRIPYTVMEGMPARENVYDIEVTAPGPVVDHLVRGLFKVLPEVTR